MDFKIPALKLPVPSGVLPLHAAVYAGNGAVVARLVATGADVYPLAKAGGTTALYWASAAGYADVAAQLLEAGADPNQRVQDVSPLVLALSLKGGPMVQALRPAGAREPLAGETVPLHVGLRSHIDRLFSEDTDIGVLLEQAATAPRSWRSGTAERGEDVAE